jgi:hypothetical protein
LEGYLEFPFFQCIIKLIYDASLSICRAESVIQSNCSFCQLIAKTAQEFGLSLGLIGRQSQRVKSADLTAFFSQYAIFPHTLSNDRAHGVLCLDPIFASALIEVQTISFVTRTACVGRTPSITDWALISPFLDQLSDQNALADILPQTEARPRFEEGRRPLKFNWPQASIAWCRERSGCRAVI